jgi:OmcA/MtrC family decaheme c-type cytochrome
MTLEERQVSVGVPASSGENRRRKVNSSLIRWGTATLVALAVAGCGGGDSSGAPPPGTSVAAALAAAAAVPANDTAINSSASFTVVQDAGVPAVTVNSPPKINFAVFSDGKVKSDLAITNVSFALAKLIPGTGGNPDQWVSYVSRTESTAKAPNNVGSGAAGAAALATAVQATTDGKMTAAELTAAGLSAQLVYNPDGYYTYVFRADIKNPAWKAPDSSTFTNGVVFEPNRTHRIAIQLSYKNAAGATILVNPYVDFTLDASGKSVFVTDPAKTRKMADVSSCNGCHDKLALHGGGRVDTQYCVMCHNPGTTDANSGNVLTMATMVHKIHSGKLLYSQTLAGSTLTPKVDKGGEEYVIWGYNATKVDFAEVGFPQDLRNCAKCHSGTNPATPQGDNWKKVVSKEACLTCHANNAGSEWETKHVMFARDPVIAGAAATPTSKAKDLTNTQCAACHVGGLSSDRVHWNQNEENAANYKMNIESASYDAATRKVTFKYFLSNPANGNTAYNLTTSNNGTNCTGTTTIACSTSTQFGNLRFLLGYQNMIGQSAAVTEFSANNNGGSGASVYAYQGANDGSNHYTASILVPADTATAVASGTARIVSFGQVKEMLLQVKSPTDPRPPVTPTTLINTVVQNTYKDVALTGALQPRRVVVASEKCNVCHGALGTTSGSNTLASAFHNGARDTVEACAVCHDANKMSSSTVMTSGITEGGVGLYESYQMKRMIHGIHGNSKRTTPYTHGNPVVGTFSKEGVLLTAGTFKDDQKVTIGTTSTVVVTAGTAVPVGTSFAGIAKIIDDAARAKGYTGAAIAAAENYAAEVAYPQVGLDCNACHVNNSYKQDWGTLGAVVGKPGATLDPNAWTVISPKAASCTSCHDSSRALGHVVNTGGARFGSATQAAIAGLPRETCDDCHAPGFVKGVDLVHGQK